MNASKSSIAMYTAVAASGALILALVLPGVSLIGTTATADSIGPHGYVVVSAKHADGSEFYHEESHNLITTAGKDFISAQVGGGGSTTTAQWIGLSTDTKAPAAADTCISTTDGGTTSAEITTNGLSRAQGTYAHTAGTNTFTVTKTFTATATNTNVQKAGLFSANVGGANTCTGGDDGTMLAENTFTSVTLANGDQLTITWTITLT